jgi:hypothetical protein
MGRGKRSSERSYICLLGYVHDSGDVARRGVVVEGPAQIVPFSEAARLGKVSGFGLLVLSLPSAFNVGLLVPGYLCYIPHYRLNLILWI